MTIEASIYTVLKGLVSNRVYPDIAPDGAAKPYITYQQVGGSAVNFVDATVPSKKNSRFQINVWGDSRSAVKAVAVQAEDALRVAAGLQTTVLSAAVSIYEPDTQLRGTRQDFSFWS